MFADNVAKLMRSDFAVIGSLHFWTFMQKKDQIPLGSTPHNMSGRVASGWDDDTWSVEPSGVWA